MVISFKNLTSNLKCLLSFSIIGECNIDFTLIN